MAIKLKTKVALGGVFLFALLILVGAVSFYYFNRLSEESKAIVRANYETLNYSREMLNELDSLSKNEKGLEQFEKNPIPDFYFDSFNNGFLCCSARHA